MEIEKIIHTMDDRRNVAIPGNAKETILFAVDYLLAIGNEAIKQRGIFTLALSGGSTPKAIYQTLASDEYRTRLDWTRVKLFWGDERSVPPIHPDSNYRMAMESLSSLPLRHEYVFRMEAEGEWEANAKHYEELIKEHVPDRRFDLVMLGMGSDGHTASLFPATHGLHTEGDRLVIENFIPKMDTWRMTLTFECINKARHAIFYVIGKDKTDMLLTILTTPYHPDLYPAQKVGTRANKALWIVDQEAASKLPTAS
jgi:6-phosphogluconolactonase